MVTLYRVEPVDIERSARGLIRFYGDGAERIATDCAQKYARANDAEAVGTWDAIARAIRLATQKQIPKEPGQ